MRSSRAVSLNYHQGWQISSPGVDPPGLPRKPNLFVVAQTSQARLCLGDEDVPGDLSDRGGGEERGGRLLTSVV